MEISEEIEQFELLEQKIEALLNVVSRLKRDRESLTEQVQIQEARIKDLSEEIGSLKDARDSAKQRIASLLQRMEQVEI